MSEATVRCLIDANPVREQGWHSAQVCGASERSYGTERTEFAYERTLRLGARFCKIVVNILKPWSRKLDCSRDECIVVAPPPKVIAGGNPSGRVSNEAPVLSHAPTRTGAMGPWALNPRAAAIS